MVAVVVSVAEAVVVVKAGVAVVEVGGNSHVDAGCVSVVVMLLLELVVVEVVVEVTEIYILSYSDMCVLA